MFQNHTVKNARCSSGIRTRNRSKREAADVRLRPRGDRGRPV